MELDPGSSSSNIEIKENNKTSNDSEFLSACNLIQTILSGSGVDNSLNSQSSENVCSEDNTLNIDDIIKTFQYSDEETNSDIVTTFHAKENEENIDQIAKDPLSLDEDSVIDQVADDALLENTLKQIQNEKVPKCGHCDFNSNWPSNSKSHLITHNNGSEKFKCEKCNFVSSQKSFETHRLKYSENQICNETQSEISIDHEDNNFSDKEMNNPFVFSNQILENSELNNVSDSLKDLNLLNNSADEEEDTNSLKDLQNSLTCELCDFETSANTVFKIHVEKHDTENKFPDGESSESLIVESENLANSDKISISQDFMSNNTRNDVSGDLSNEELTNFCNICSAKTANEDDIAENVPKKNCDCCLNSKIEFTANTVFKIHVEKHDTENKFPDGESSESLIVESENLANSDKISISQDFMSNNARNDVSGDLSNEELTNFCNICSAKTANEDDIAENVPKKNCDCCLNSKIEFTSRKVLRVKLFDVKHVDNKMYNDFLSGQNCSSERSASANEDDYSSNVITNVVSANSAITSSSITLQNKLENIVNNNYSYNHLSKLTKAAKVCSVRDEHEKFAEGALPLTDLCFDIEKSQVSTNNEKNENSLRKDKTFDILNIFDDCENEDFYGFDESISVKKENAKIHKRSRIFSYKISPKCGRKSQTFYYCSECSYRSLWKFNVKVHMKKRHSIDTFYKCKICSCVVNTYKELKVHEAEHKHLKSVNGTTDSLVRYQNIIETDCEAQESTEMDNYIVSKILPVKTKIYSSKSSIRGSSEKFHKLFYCSECTYKSRFNQNVRSHMKTRHSLENFYQCKECNCMKSTRKELREHVAECSNITSVNKITDFPSFHPDKSPKESKCANRKSPTFLKATENGKSRSKVYQSNESYQISSNKLSEDDKNEYSPISDDNNRKKYRCSFCLYSNDNLYMTKQHVLTHTDLRLYKCKYCDFKSNVKKSIRNHYLRYHISTIINNSSQEDQGDVEGILNELCKVDMGSFNISSLYISIKNKERGCNMKSPNTNEETPFNDQNDFSGNSSPLSDRSEISLSRETNISNKFPPKKRKAGVKLKSRKKFKNNNMNSQIIKRKDKSITESSHPIETESDFLQHLEFPKFTAPGSQVMNRNDKKIVSDHKSAISNSVLKTPGSRSEPLKRKKGFVNEYSEDYSSEYLQRLKSSKLNDGSIKLRDSGLENSITESVYDNNENSIKEIDKKVNEKNRKKDMVRDFSYCYMLSKYLEDLGPLECIKCDNCEFTAKSVSVLRRHICGSKFLNDELIEKISSPVSKQTLELVEKKKCEHCDFTTTSERNLTRHKCKSKSINEHSKNNLSQKDKRKQDKETDNMGIDNPEPNHLNGSSLSTVNRLIYSSKFSNELTEKNSIGSKQNSEIVEKKKCEHCDFSATSERQLTRHKCKSKSINEYIKNNLSQNGEQKQEKETNSMDMDNPESNNLNDSSLNNVNCELTEKSGMIFKKHISNSKFSNELSEKNSLPGSKQNLELVEKKKCEHCDFSATSERQLARHKCKSKSINEHIKNNLSQKAEQKQDNETDNMDMDNPESNHLNDSSLNKVNCEVTVKSTMILRKHIYNSKFSNEHFEKNSSPGCKQNLELVEKKKCEHCDFTTISKRHLTRHTRHKCKSKPVNELGQKNLSKKNEKKQDEAEIGNAEPTVRVLEPLIKFKCFFCDFIGLSESDLKTHSCKVANCELTPDNSIKNVNKLDSENTYKCSHCKFETISKYVLKRHTCKPDAFDKQFLNRDSVKSVKNFRLEKSVKCVTTELTKDSKNNLKLTEDSKNYLELTEDSKNTLKLGEDSKSTLEFTKDSKNTLKRYKCREKPFKCKYCNYATNKIILLMEHSGTIHSNSEFLHFSGKTSPYSIKSSKTKISPKVEKYPDEKHKDLSVEENSDTLFVEVIPQKAKAVVKNKPNESPNGSSLSDVSVPRSLKDNEKCENGENEYDSRDNVCDSQEIECDSRDNACDSQEIECDSQEIECDSQEIECDSQEIECDSQEIECDSKDNESESQSQDTNSKLLKCPFCLYNSPHVGYLKRHLQRMHIKPVISREKKKKNLTPKMKYQVAPMLTCVHCSFKTKLMFNYKRHIEMHIKKQLITKEKRLQKNMSKSVQKKSHAISKVKENQKLKKKKEYNVSSNIIKRHSTRKSHEGECNISPLSEPKLTNCNKNRKGIEEIGKEICQNIKTKDTLHSQKNIAQEIFSCTNCEFKSYFRKSMIRHMKTHSSAESSLFKCLHCKFSTDVSVIFEKHKQNCNGLLTSKIISENVKKTSPKDRNNEKKSGSLRSKKSSFLINKSNVNRTKSSSKNLSKTNVTEKKMNNFKEKISSTEKNTNNSEKKTLNKEKNTNNSEKKTLNTEKKTNNTGKKTHATKTNNTEKNTNNSEKKTLNTEKNTNNSEKKTLNTEKKTNNTEKNTNNSEKKTLNTEKNTNNSEKKTLNTEKKTNNTGKKTHNTEKKTYNTEKKTSNSEKKTNDSEKKTNNSEKKTNTTVKKANNTENNIKSSTSKSSRHSSTIKKVPSIQKKTDSTIKGRPPTVNISEILKSNPNLRIFDCLVCKYKTIYRSALLYHITSQKHKGNLYHCNLCRFRIHDKSKLIRHKTMSHKDVKILLRCKSCDFVTSWKGALKTHNLHFHP